MINNLLKNVDNSIFKRIWDNGGRVFLVGGAVRDLLLDREVNDLDFCVTGFNSREFEELFKESQMVGNDFSVFLIDGHEFALARKERKIGDSRHDFDVDDNNISIEEDLERRDFTINSMAVDIMTGELIDPFDGQKDLENKKIKHTSKAFSEDELRVYRACRFSAQLGFEVSFDTGVLMNELKDRLSELTIERVFVEFRKALNSEHPERFFLNLFNYDLLDVHFEEIRDLVGVPQPEEHHREGDAFTHSILSLVAMSKMSEDESLRFAALVHDLGKIETPEEEYPHHYKHDKLGISSLDRLSSRLRIPNKWYDAGKIAVEEHMRGSLWREMGPGKVVRLMEKADNNHIGVEGLEKIIKADKKARDLHLEGDSSVMDGFVDVGLLMFEEVNGKTVDFGDREGKAVGDFIFNRRAHWLKRERNKLP
jgi:tRNA nucleotidyltransferase (CCA-adding enzyme)